MHKYVLVYVDLQGLSTSYQTRTFEAPFRVAVSAAGGTPLTAEAAFRRELCVVAPVLIVTDARTVTHPLTLDRLTLLSLSPRLVLSERLTSN